MSDLVKLGESLGLENLARLRKQDIIFAILKAHAKSGEDLLAMGFWKFFKTVLVSYVVQTVHTLLALTTSMCHLAKFVDLTNVQATQLPGKFVRRKRVNVTLHCSK